MCWCLLARKKKVIKRWRKKDTLKVKRSDIDLWKDSVAIAEKSKRKKTEINTVDLVSSLIHNVKNNSVNEMNNLLYAGAYVVAEKLGEMTKNKSNEKRKEPLWKKRIQENIVECWKGVNRLKERRKGTFEFEKKHLDRIERKYQLSDVGNVQVIDILKNKIWAGATKIIPYEERELHYFQNTLFATNQKQFYHQLFGWKKRPYFPSPKSSKQELFSNQ